MIFLFFFVYMFFFFFRGSCLYHVKKLRKRHFHFHPFLLFCMYAYPASVHCISHSVENQWVPRNSLILRVDSHVKWPLASL